MLWAAKWGRAGGRVPRLSQKSLPVWPAVATAVRIWGCAAAVGPHRGVSLPGLSHCLFPTPPLPPALSWAHLPGHFGSGRPPGGPRRGARLGVPRAPAAGTCGADGGARSGPVKCPVPAPRGPGRTLLRGFSKKRPDSSARFPAFDPAVTPLGGSYL